MTRVEDWPAGGVAGQGEGITRVSLLALYEKVYRFDVLEHASGKRRIDRNRSGGSGYPSGPAATVFQDKRDRSSLGGFARDSRETAKRTMNTLD